jgi:hypothetical protein
LQEPPDGHIGHRIEDAARKPTHRILFRPIWAYAGGSVLVLRSLAHTK